MKVHLVDGKYELFRHFFGAPPHRNAAGQEVAAVRGVVGSVLQLLGEGATHVGVATDHVIESFRNDLWPGYKTGAGIDPDLWSQAWPLEESLAALGVCMWPMVDLEADDALASAAAVADHDGDVDQVIICMADKDLGQCVRGRRIVQLDRRKNLLIDADGVVAKFGVGPTSIPDYLALVGDSADGFPGLAGWGAKSAATVLARWVHLEDIPPDPADWVVTVRGAPKLATTLQERRADALLFRQLATLRVDTSLLGGVEDLRWRGPTSEFGLSPAPCPRALHLQGDATCHRGPRRHTVRASSGALGARPGWRSRCAWSAVSRAGWQDIEISYQKALEEISQGHPDDAITDAATALQDTLTLLGCHGHALGPLISDAKKRGLIAAHDAPIFHWVSADRSETGDGHHKSNATVEDAWLAVHVVGALILRLVTGGPRAT
jgi:5'-3' exonuclease